MKHVWNLARWIGLCFVLVAGTLQAGPATQPATQSWNSQRFNYDRPAHLTIEQITPATDHFGFVRRPNIADPAAIDPVETPAAKPRTLDGMDFVHLRFKDSCGKIVPALLCRPPGNAGPLPVVIAVHGLGSNKAQVCAQVGPALTKHGFAILAADMPCHGERSGEPRDILSQAMADSSHTVYAEAIIDVRQLIDVAEQLPDLDTHNGVTLVGYSLGSWISSLAAPADDRVKTLVLMVGGALDIPEVALAIPDVAATDPRLAIVHFAGKPILMLNGKNDKTVPPETANRLWTAAPEPKEQRWYDSGHLLPKQAYEDAAVWIEQHAR
jgi:dienelactone hydrolase